MVCISQLVHTVLMHRFPIWSTNNAYKLDCQEWFIIYWLWATVTKVVIHKSWVIAWKKIWIWSNVGSIYETFENNRDPKLCHKPPVESHFMRKLKKIHIGWAYFVHLPMQINLLLYHLSFHKVSRTYHQPNSVEYADPHVSDPHTLKPYKTKHN